MVREDGKVVRVALSEGHGVSFVGSNPMGKSFTIEHLEVDDGVRC